MLPRTRTAWVRLFLVVVLFLAMPPGMMRGLGFWPGAPAPHAHAAADPAGPDPADPVEPGLPGSAQPEAADSAGPEPSEAAEPGPPGPEETGPPALPAEVSFREETVTVGEEPWLLEGTLTLPDRPGPFPGVVLVADFGPYDRDETAGPDRPFRDLARGLGRRGIASLRFDKRTAVYGPKMDGNAITVEEEVIADALSAASLLREQEGVGPVFILGHGLGATLAPEIARRAGAAGAVLLAPFATPLDELVRQQLEASFSADGRLTLTESAQLERARAAVEQFRQGKTDPAQTFLGPSRYFVDLRQRNPLRQAVQYLQPMLILQGGRDEQVPPSELDRWRQALAGRRDVELRLYAELNHRFAWGPDPSPSTTYRWPRQVQPEVIEAVALWILRQAPAAGEPRGAAEDGPGAPAAGSALGA
ncbi:alpha/beta hydrolase family protein [Limnochorda pilosa]|uniref:Serine aminopeptidase S33 domain-containing protein n=1 Tax=Limnochorda pilosa TaxID=1555112 RepID=A0A0K2SMB1_LIMPI|nr:alpha/beta hydrolase [Limnochorda pilosa]BAS28258.1 hypothetical protein LIP_2417 [Limnochorda pilosa]